MNDKVRSVIQRAQKHGWRVQWVGDTVILLCQCFYRRKLVQVALWPDGTLRRCPGDA